MELKFEFYWPIDVVASANVMRIRNYKQRENQEKEGGEGNVQGQQTNTARATTSIYLLMQIKNPLLCP